MFALHQSVCFIEGTHNSLHAIGGEQKRNLSINMESALEAIHKAMFNYICRKREE